MATTFNQRDKEGASGLEVIVERRDFDDVAAAWDEDPGRVKVAADIAQAIVREVPMTSDMDVLDFGCGTGLVSMALRPFVRSVTGVDSSAGMLGVFEAKVARLGVANVRAQFCDLARGDTLNGRYDLVVSAMTLHHVEEIEPLLDKLALVTAPGGRLCIADLDLDDGQFHDDNTGVFHFGFDRAALRAAFAKAGFENVEATDAAEVVKPGRDGEVRRFTVFIVTGTKGGAS
jgi:2-polyprenyl-3-methyl-5-hydroxy-6-metoxy-1,4-benzoquinol methylase